MNSPFIVAELSANHLGSYDRAYALVEAAAKAGADAIKLQTFTPEQMCEPDTIVQDGPWAGRRLIDLYRECHTPRAWHQPLFLKAKSLGMPAFSSVFHTDDVDFLETLDCPRYKISSFEILDLPLIRYAASKGKPVIISTGMATFNEIHDACMVAGDEFVLLKCTSSYPAMSTDANLLTGRICFGLRWGLSDHTLGLGVATAAVALGAKMIEKHLTLRRSDGGPDAAFSSEPEEFAAMVKACREAAAALGEVRYGPTESELSSLQFRRKPGGKRGG